MWGWLCGHRKDPPNGVDPEAGDRELHAAQQTLDQAQRNQQQRAPVFAEAERNVARDSIYDDLLASLRLKGGHS